MGLESLGFEGRSFTIFDLTVVGRLVGSVWDLGVQLHPPLLENWRC